MTPIRGGGGSATMKDDRQRELMHQLLAEIEAAWRQAGDRTLVFRLAEQHPELADDLHEFFSDLVLGPTDQGTPTELAAEERIALWLRETRLPEITRLATDNMTAGSTGANDPAEGPIENQDTDAPAKKDDLRGEGSRDRTRTSSWILFLRQRSRLSAANIARALPHVTVEYLALVSRHPNLLPATVRAELADEAERRLGIARTESLHYLESAPSYARAASRPTEFGPGPRTFGELLDRAALSPEQHRYWLERAGRG